jgi:hypothetical protein
VKNVRSIVVLIPLVGFALAGVIATALAAIIGWSVHIDYRRRLADAKRGIYKYI